MKTRSNSKNRSRLNLIILLCFLRPHFSFLPPIVSVYIFDVIIIGLVIIYSSGIIRYSKEGVMSVIGLSVIMLIKIILGLFEMDLLLSIVKIAYYIIVFFAIKRLFEIEYAEEDFFHILNIVFYINVIVVVLQLLDPPVLGNIVRMIYGSVKLRSIWGGYPRIYGTFFNANWFGVYLIFMVSYYSVHFMKDYKIFSFFIRIMVLIVLLFVSGSRTAMIGSVIAIIVAMVGKKQIKALLITIVVVIGISLLAINIAQSIPLMAKTLERFTSYLTAISGNNVEISDMAGSRFSEWIDSWVMFKDNPFFGSTLGNIIPHNTYISFLLRFGMIGCIFLIPFFVKILFNVKRISKRQDLKLVTIAFLMSFLVVCFSGDYFFSTQVMLIPIVLLAAASGIDVKNLNATANRVNNFYNNSPF